MYVLCGPTPPSLIGKLMFLTRYVHQNSHSLLRLDRRGEVTQEDFARLATPEEVVVPNKTYGTVKNLATQPTVS
jgi:hypothetical protein